MWCVCCSTSTVQILVRGKACVSVPVARSTVSATLKIEAIRNFMFFCFQTIAFILNAISHSSHYIFFSPNTSSKLVRV